VRSCDDILSNASAADTTDITDDADSDLDMPDDLLDQSDDEDRKRDSFAAATADEKVHPNCIHILYVVYWARSMGPWRSPLSRVVVVVVVGVVVDIDAQAARDSTASDIC